MRLRRATAKEIRVSCMRYHYAHAVPSVQFGYSVFTDGGGFCGTVCFGSGANKSIGSPYGLVPGQVLELVRVALNGEQGHGHTSEAVAAALRMLRRDAPLCRLVVSYADEDQDHLGIIYQATNWIYVGEMNAGGRGRIVVDGVSYHPKSLASKGLSQSIPWLREHVDPDAHVLITKGKLKYLMPMDKKMRRQVMRLALPYPVRENA